MTAQKVDQAVTVLDNGIRSFIPPNFCFELVDRSGALFAIVSEVVVADNTDIRDFDAVALLEREQAWATGEIEEYDAGPKAQKNGMRFTIRHISK